ncbi:MAG: hypothetical protein G8345_04795 [Magnetococcales bacterium]|nr:hypothetical protein [Magnetococcales bacterium]NGZ26188.1 hypothetical protein [Magnetococcales bacterium]
MFIILLIFILFGPFVGGLVFWSGVELYSLLFEPNGSGSLLSVLMLSLFGYPVSLLYGCVPATVSGLWYGYLLKHRTIVNYSPGKRLIVGLAIGFLVSSLFTLSLGMSMSSESAWSLLPTFALPGALAGAVSGWCVSDRLYCRLFKCAPPQTLA